jgi:hypothetical protein
VSAHTLRYYERIGLRYLEENAGALEVPRATSPASTPCVPRATATRT